MRSTVDSSIFLGNVHKKSVVFLGDKATGMTNNHSVDGDIQSSEEGIAIGLSAKGLKINSAKDNATVRLAQPAISKKCSPRDRATTNLSGSKTPRETPGEAISHIIKSRVFRLFSGNIKVAMGDTHWDATRCSDHGHESI